MKKFIALLCAAYLTIVTLNAQTFTQGPYGTFFRATTAIGTATLTVQQMVGLLVGTPTGAATYTTPTATQLCNAFPAIANVPPGSTFAFRLVIVNTSAGANTITLAAGSGVTANGTLTTAQNKLSEYIVYPTNCAAGSQAWVVQSVSNGVAF